MYPKLNIIHKNAASVALSLQHLNIERELEELGFFYSRIERERNESENDA